MKFNGSAAIVHPNNPDWITMDAVRDILALRDVCFNKCHYVFSHAWRKYLKLPYMIGPKGVTPSGLTLRDRILTCDGIISIATTDKLKGFEVEFFELVETKT